MEDKNTDGPAVGGSKFLAAASKVTLLSGGVVPHVPVMLERPEPVECERVCVWVRVRG